MNEPKLVFTSERPKKPGFYWFCNFGEHTPVVLEVVKAGDNLYAQNEEFGFPIKENPSQKELALEETIPDDDVRETDGNDKYKYGDDLWCYIPNPWLPNLSKQVEPDCY